VSGAERDVVGAGVTDSKLLHELVRASVPGRRDAIAVSRGTQRLTYGELDAGAEHAARALAHRGCGPGDVVALCMAPSPDLIVALLGVLYAGAAFLLVDRDHPVARRRFIAGDAGACLVITADDARDPAFDGRPCVSAGALLDPTQQDLPVPPTAAARDLAYICYTSGSTGQPKGVMVEHRNAVHAVSAGSELVPQAPEALVLAFSISFDGAIMSIFETLSRGGRLVLPPDGVLRDAQQMARLIGEEVVSHLVCVPGLYAELLASAGAGDLASLRYVALAGEAWSPGLAAEHRRQLPGCRLVNRYGPTEGSIWATAHVVSPTAETGGSVPIGRALPRTQVHVLDADLAAAPTGAQGEIYLGGPGVTRGYLGRPGLTAERFLPDPFGGGGGRLYRTGDLGRRRDDGSVEFVGRVDDEVKIRGHRVDLREIEELLGRQPEVLTAVAFVAQRGETGAVLEAAVVAPTRVDDPEFTRALRDGLRAWLPSHMLPTIVHLVVRLPTTPHGKVDRRALQALTQPPPRDPVLHEAGALATGAGARGRPGLEHELCALWAGMLGRPAVAPSDNVFDLGGHSLMLTRVRARLQAMGHDVAIVDFFRHPTPAALAAFLTGRGASNDQQAGAARGGRRRARQNRSKGGRHERSRLA
jgi:amino acid adenylation domain-containing protein